MAKVDGLHQSPRAPSFRRALYFRPSPTGVVASSYPLNRKRKLSPKQQEAVDAFREAAIVAKYAPAGDQMTSRHLARGSQFLPRDLQYLAIFGRLCTLFFTNGERVYQMASRVDLSELLDILGFEPGTVLTRGPQFWEGLPPGPAGWVLTTGDPGFGARWAPPADAGVTGRFDGATIINLSAADTSQNYYKGSLFVPHVDIIVTGLRAVTNQLFNNATMTMEVWRMTTDDASSVPVQMEIDTPIVTKNGSVASIIRFPINQDAPRLLAGVPYLFAFKVANVGTFNRSMWYFGPQNPNCIPNAPIEPLDVQFNYNTLSLSPGQLPDEAWGRRLLFWPSGYIAPPE